MDETKPTWQWLERLSQYIKDGYHRHDMDYQTGVHIRSFVRWWMEFCRNFIVVVIINYLAEKSGSKILIGFAWVTYFIFYAYVTSYFNNWSFTFFPYIKRPHIHFLVNAGIWVPLTTAVLIGCSVAFRLAYEGLLTAQGH